MRLIVTSDLHYDSRGYLTQPAQIRALAEEIAGLGPDAVILAGDIAHGLDDFSACVGCFSGLSCPVGVIAGNHDLWRDKERKISSQDLWTTHLPAVTRQQGAQWIEEDTLCVDGVALVASVAWYDYSAVDPTVQLSRDTLALLKRRLNNDATWIDWSHTDPDFAQTRRESVVRRLRRAEDDPTIRASVLVTHVPVLEEQMQRKPHDPTWGASNAYFGHLTLGDEILGFAKLRAVLSGHTHGGMQATRARGALSPLEVRVVTVDYGAPGYTLFDL
jgi:predicted MPP superfamily phosphohydrolase